MRLRRHPGAAVGAVLVGTVLALAAIGPLAAPYDPAAIQPGGLDELDGTPSQPSERFPLGTDGLGRDVLSRLLHGARVSLTVALVATVIAVVVGVGVGVTAGYAGGWLDFVSMRLVDTLLALPFLLLAITARRAVEDPGLVVLCLLLGLLSWTPMARVVRARALEVRSLAFVEAARGLGMPEARILWVHVLPNVFGAILVLGTTLVARMVLFESAMSFLGLGVQPPQASWGSMVSEAYGIMAWSPWPVVYPGVLIVVTVFGFNLLGEALRDALDPTR